jgi:hypothetical protein
VFSGQKAALLGIFALIGAVACGSPERPRATLQPEYDSQTGKLRLLRYDTNADGHVDIWTFMDGTRVIRVEIDRNEDGRIERWEHYGGPNNALVSVGFSRLNDGVEDAWTYANPDGTVVRIEISTRRNGRVTRTEFYERNSMVRSEEDTDADGKLDKWETFDNGRLATVAVDTTGSGTPTRRVTHLPDGTARVEHLSAK